MSQEKGRIYEYAVIYHPKRKTKDDPQKKSEVIVDVKRDICASEQEALILASRAIPEGYLDKLDQVEIAVRPF